MVVRSGAVFATRVTGVALSFVVSVFFARALGVEQYGIFVFWTTAAGLVATLASFGTPTLVMRELAAARGADDRPKQARVFTFGTGMTGIVTLLLLAAGAIAAIQVRPAEGVSWLLAVPFLAFIVPAVAAWASLHSSLLLGHEKVIAGQVLALVTPAASATGAAILWLWYSDGSLASDAILVSIAAAAVGVLASWLCVRRLVPSGDRVCARPGAVVEAAPSWLKLGIVLAINQVLVNAITQIDILMMGWLSTPIETANYHVASRISYVAAFFFGSVVAVTAPTIARLHAAGDSHELARAVQRGSLLAFSATVMLALIIIAFSSSILDLFGRGFSAAEVVMRILIGSWVLHAAFGLNHTLLTMAGAARLAATGLAAAAVLNIALNALMVPVWGAEGAALASLVSTFLVTVTFWLVVRARHRFSVDCVTVVTKLFFSCRGKFL